MQDSLSWHCTFKLYRNSLKDLGSHQNWIHSLNGGEILMRIKFLIFKSLLASKRSANGKLLSPIVICLNYSPHSLSIICSPMWNMQPSTFLIISQGGISIVLCKFHFTSNWEFTMEDMSIPCVPNILSLKSKAVIFLYTGE